MKHELITVNHDHPNQKMAKVMQTVNMWSDDDDAPYFHGYFPIFKKSAGRMFLELTIPTIIPGVIYVAH